MTAIEVSGLVKQFKQHRALYDELLDRVRIQGDWEAWVDFFLAGVEQPANAAVQTARQLAAMFAQDAQRANRAGRGSSMGAIPV